MLPNQPSAYTSWRKTESSRIATIRSASRNRCTSPFLAATVGNDVRNGKFGQELYEMMMKPEGVISGEINYLYPKPGTTAPPLPKTSIATRVALDLGCAVGYYASARSELGSADDAKAMLVKVNAAVKADRDIALAQFNKGEVGFRNGDLYPFCTRISDAKGVAGSVYTPAGVDVTKLIDAKGHAYGAEMLISMTRARIRC